MNKDTSISNKVNGDNQSFILYYHSNYLEAQQYADLRCFENDRFRVYFNIVEGNAISLNASPFGGLQSIKGASYSDFEAFFDQIKTELFLENVRKIEVIQPPEYYLGFVEMLWLKQIGFTRKVSETNQYVSLNKSIHFHKMQKRQLNKNKDLVIRKTSLSELSKIHQFIADCRKEQGLTINISQEKLCSLFSSLPAYYDAFIVEKEGSMISAVIMTKPTSNICYYYLPATKAEFKPLSPMVHLMAYLYDYYQEQGFSYMDLGISSIDGKLQEYLAEFKERMGAQTTRRVSWKMEI